MKKMNLNPFFFAMAMLALPLHLSGQTLLSEDFESGSAARWVIYAGGNGVTNDYSVQFGFNYSTQTFQFNGTVPNPLVPTAPSGTGTRGVKVTANKNRTSGTRIAAVSLYPNNGVVFSNNYALRFDMFMDYNGDAAGGGTGSTEYSQFGINHVGNKVNWRSTSSAFVGTQWPSDGLWFMVDGEAGRTGAPDYEALVGDPTPGPAVILGDLGGFLYPQDVDYSDYNSAIAKVLPAPPGQSPGAPGKQWVKVEIRQQDGFVTWLINGSVIASHNNLNGYTQGTIMIGYSDPLSGVANPPNENYAIFDNVRVVDLGTNPAPPTVKLTMLDSQAAEPSDAASFSLSLVDKDGNPVTLASPLTINLGYSGSASNGIDYVGLPTSITVPSGVQSTNINITPINDSLGEPAETIIVRVLGSTNYDLRTDFLGTFDLLDDGDITSANLGVIKPVAYENLRAAKINLYLSGAPSSSVTVNYTISGTATNGVDYVTIPSSGVIPAGTTNVTIDITPINNSVLNSNRTVTLRLAAGTGYAIGSSSNVTVTIRDDDLTPAGAILFTDGFETVGSSANWIQNKSTNTDLVSFGYDYSLDGIPSAPNTTNGTTKGVKLEANINGGARQGLSLSPVGGNYVGDYRLRFDAWINYEGPLNTLNTAPGEFLSLGVGTSGDHPNWDNTGADGVWFDVLGNGSSTVAADFEAFQNTTSLLVGASSVWTGGSQSHGSPYYAEFGLETAPQIQLNNALGADMSGTTPAGVLGFAWHDMVVVKQGTNVSWYIDGLRIATVPSDAVTLSTNVFVGYYDANSVASTYKELSFAIIDNLRIESLTVTPPTITSITKSNSNVIINFTGASSDVTNAFTVRASSTLSTNSAAYSPVAATITGSNGTYQASTAFIASSNMFYRIQK